jgi:hypothetical protein
LLGKRKQKERKKQKKCKYMNICMRFSYLTAILSALSMQSMAFRTMSGLRAGSRIAHRSFAAAAGSSAGAKNPRVFFDLEIQANPVGTVP